MGAPLVSTAISSLGVNQETPTGTGIVGDMGIYLLDQAVYFGVPVLSPYLALFKVAYAIDNYSPPSNTNILLSSGVATFMPGGETFLDPNTGAPTTLLKVPEAPAGGTFDTTTLVVPPSTSYTLTLSTNGSGSITSFPTGTSLPAGTVVGLTPVPSTDSTFANWGGACSGTGTCSVTMNANQSVSATFTNGAVDWVTPSITLGTLSGCAGGNLSGTINVTAAPGVTWKAGTEYSCAGPSSDPCGTISPSSGTGSGTITLVLTVPPQSPSQGYTCADTVSIPWGDTRGIGLGFSDQNGYNFVNVNVNFLEVY